jgi:hypothetical protein
LHRSHGGVLQVLFILAIAILGSEPDRGPTVKFDHYL